MIILAAYREWAIEACSGFTNNVIIVEDDKMLGNVISVNSDNIEAIIFVGWSTIIKSEIITSYLCMCYHPSDLPKYRGGSPLQHQIMDGLTSTYATLFKMNDKIDSGPIYFKDLICLKGNMKMIFKELSRSAQALIEKFIDDLRNNNQLIFINQNEDESTFFRRRTPDMSEITIDELQNSTGEYLYNKVRSLGDPYPNAYIKTNDGKILLIKELELR